MGLFSSVVADLEGYTKYLFPWKELLPFSLHLFPICPDLAPTFPLANGGAALTTGFTCGACDSTFCSCDVLLTNVLLPPPSTCDAAPLFRSAFSAFLSVSETT